MVVSAFFRKVLENMPCYNVLNEGISVLDFIVNSKLTITSSKVRYLLVYNIVNDINFVANISNFDNKFFCFIKEGKKKFIKILTNINKG